MDILYTQLLVLEVGKSPLGKRASKNETVGSIGSRRAGRLLLWLDSEK
jgi:hypothetical protein